MTALELREVDVSRDGHPIINDINLTVGNDELVALVGPSGCGKSTLLAAIAGLLPIDRGTIQLDGVRIDRVPAHRRRIALVPQGDHLFPHLDVAGNIAYGLRRARWTTEDCDHRISELLRLIDMEDFRSRSVDQLSGGQAKRVALARSLAPRPPTILLDEPLTGLDPTLHDRLLADLVALLHTEKTSAIWVTHDMREALRAADRVVRMDDRGSIGSDRPSWRSDVVIPLAVENTYDLRRRVLRDGTPTTNVVFDGDESAIHLGIERDGRLIAVSSWYRRSHPSVSHLHGMQLRGMASDPTVRGSGAAARLLDAGIDTARSIGADHVWARARDTALDFYLRHGFHVVGAGYIDSTTALAHHDIMRKV